MRKLLILNLLAYVVASPAIAGIKVYVDYDSTATFAQYKTFQFIETREDLRDSSITMHRQVVSGIRAYAVDGGLKEVSSEPDVYIAYYTADKGRLGLALTDLDYTYGPDFTLGKYWSGGVGSRTPDTFYFADGTLVIDVWDASDQRLVWRGLATSAVPNKRAKVEKKIDKALEKITKEWEKLFGGYLRALRAAQAGDSR